jgi:ankyrin repeat protein
MAVLAIVSYSTAFAGELLPALRAGNTNKVEALLKRGASANEKDSSGTTALMYAALYADAGAMRLLLARGAEVNARNEAGATALMWSVYDSVKVRLLLDHGADVNAVSKEGRTALLIAAHRPSSTAVVRMLMSKGADPHVRDALGGSALMMAAETGNVELMRLLVDNGADVNAAAAALYGFPRFGRVPEGLANLPAGATGLTPLIIAAENGHAEAVRYLLAKGADPKRRTTVFQGDALLAAAGRRDPELARLLLEAGADANSRDYRKATPLTLAAASDEAPAATIDLLLKHGADAQAVDSFERKALDWAAMRGATAVSKRLGFEAPGGADRMAPSRARPTVRQAVERSLPLLFSASDQFMKKTGCISCHHQSLAAMAADTARANGFHVDQAAATRQLKSTMAVFQPHRETLLQAVPTVPATTIVSSYGLLGMAAEKQPANETIDALVHELATKQQPDGHWPSESDRPPLDQGDVTSTALSLRAIQLYPLPGRRQEFATRVAKAREWLIRAQALTTQEKAMRVLGLTWSGAPARVVRQTAAALLADQRADGGWAQLATIGSDAYATGQALYALYQAGAVKSSDAAFRRGVDYLLDTQQPDGSWHVKSRALGFQPYFESGYPYGPDQWVSAAGGSWATMALSLTGARGHQ